MSSYSSPLSSLLSIQCHLNWFHHHKFQKITFFHLLKWEFIRTLYLNICACVSRIFLKGVIAAVPIDCIAIITGFSISIQEFTITSSKSACYVVQTISKSLMKILHFTGRRLFIIVIHSAIFSLFTVFYNCHSSANNPMYWKG
jgi:hypothetical protein